MKLLTGLLVCLLVSLALPLSAQDPAKIANIEEIFRLTKVDQIQQQMFGQMKSMAASQMQNSGASEKDQAAFKESQDKLFAMIADRLSWDKMKAGYIKLYDETFTASEIAGMLAFYKTPAGSAMLEKMPVLMSRSMQIAQQQMGDIMPEIQKMVEEAKAKEKQASPARP